MISIFSRIVAVVMSLITAFSNFLGTVSICRINDYEFSVNMSELGSQLSNVSSNANVWNARYIDFNSADTDSDTSVFKFVRYIQLMQCTGGSVERDLFVDPLDRSVLDDYDFSTLIESCRGVLNVGAKPHLKLGSVPLKYSAKASTQTTFGTNVYPPDDYNVYYNYIAAIAQALVDTFGLDEVRTWRFGVMTEYENDEWFLANSGNAEDTAQEFFKLYDYTVAALTDVIGNDVFVGAHSMTVTEGLWDEALFIQHCANGTNYKTGEKGSRLCFLSSSFYDVKPGEYTSGKTMPQSINYLRDTAEKAGLTDLIYGIDEGRILFGNAEGKIDKSLTTRICGYTYQAAYDARLVKQMFDNSIDYFSSWGYLSNGLLSGNPTVSYYVAENAAKFEGARAAKTERTHKGLLINAEVEATAAYNEKTQTAHIMAYNFKNKVNYKLNADVKLSVNAPQFDGKNVKITRYVIDDDCNYFDDWVKDRKTYGINDDCFLWSPDDPQIDSASTLNDPNAREIYFKQLYSKYTDASRLTPTETVCKVENGEIKLDVRLSPNTVVFYEITQCD